MANTYSILKRIKYPFMKSPGLAKVRLNANFNSKELALARNPMTGLFEGLVDKYNMRQPWNLVPWSLSFTIPKPNKKQDAIGRRLATEDYLKTANPNSARKLYTPHELVYFEQGKYPVGYWGPHNYLCAPLLQGWPPYRHNPLLYRHVPNPYTFFAVPKPERAEKNNAMVFAPDRTPSHGPG